MPGALRPTPHTCLPASSPAPSTPQAELSRIAAGEALRRPDVGRFVALAAPPPDAPVEAWAAAVDRARVALEAQALRAVNLELAARYGAEAWKGGVAQLDAVAAAGRSRLAAATARVEDVNASRKAAQEPHGARLRALGRRWRETVETNGQIAGVLGDAEREVKRLRALARGHGLLPDEEEGEEKTAAAEERGGGQ
jgi:hypothetical protein